MSLALDVGMSARHLSYIETGRSQPSRGLIIQLCEALEVPLRERNLLLLSAGYAPTYLDRDAGSPELAEIEAALGLILSKQEPFPAVVMDRYWNYLRINRAAETLLKLFIPVPAPFALNALRLIFHPRGLRPFLEGWDLLAARLLQRVHRAILVNPFDEGMRQLLGELMSYGEAPPAGRAADIEAPPPPLHPLTLRHGTRIWRFYSTVATLGTAQDVSLQELRIESFFPADSATREALEAAARAAP